jgi:predicted NBD/HSP70 family sugar kinase
VSADPDSAANTWDAGLTGNALRVAAALRTHGPCTRGQLVQATGLSRPTVSSTLTELLRAGLVVDETRAASGAAGGRPAALARLSRAAGVAVGVDVGRRHVRVAVADLGHEVLAEREVRLAQDADDHPDNVLDLATALVADVLSEVDIGHSDMVGVGLGLPAPITNDGRIGSPMLLPAWADRDPGAELARRLSTPVRVDNDANVGALGEHRWGAGQDCADLVYVKVGTGIGAGIVLSGRLYRGAVGTAGELGHVTLDARGPVCRCGNRGCLELTAGGRALLEHARATQPQLADLDGLVALAAGGDPGCRRLLADAGTQLGLALGGLVNLLNPQRIVIGGPLSAAFNLLRAPIHRGLSDTSMPAAAGGVDVVPAKLGERASALGSVALVLGDPVVTTRAPLAHVPPVASPG